ncbi:MAG: RluA family pseudouridine synthase [Burkholderiales bacterium]
MQNISKDPETGLVISPDSAGQRIDNFLIKTLKGVPKSCIYRILRCADVRVNKRRVKASYRLQAGDNVRIPPLRISSAPAAPPPPRLAAARLYHDEALLAIDKPAGVAVHGGSGVSHGVIEQLRAAQTGERFLELVHRLDRDTSGVLLLAKKRAALTGLHCELREGRVEKRYLVLVKGEWDARIGSIALPLHKYINEQGERRVAVNDNGKPSQTLLKLKRVWPGFSLLEAQLKTGRTHQIRVHLTHLGFPIAGDPKYGDFEFNRQLRKRGLKRMFLHARLLRFKHPISGESVRIEAPLPDELDLFVQSLERATG